MLYALMLILLTHEDIRRPLAVPFGVMSILGVGFAFIPMVLEASHRSWVGTVMALNIIMTAAAIATFLRAVRHTRWWVQDVRNLPFIERTAA
jgi:hypothetical protein